MEMDATYYESELLNNVLFCPLNKQLLPLFQITIHFGFVLESNFSNFDQVYRKMHQNIH